MSFKKKFLLSALALAFSATTFNATAALSRNPVDNIFYATSADPLGLDPALIDDFDAGNIIGNIYEGLVQIKPDNSAVIPQLAKSWTISEDGLTYTFKLRDDVMFHDGSKFNAEAVKINIDRQMPEVATPKMSYAGLVYGDVEKVTVIDEYTVEIKLLKSSTPFLRNIAMQFAAPIVSPKALQEFNNNVNEHPVGTGPYKFLAWDKGQQVVLTRFEEYYGEKAKTQNLIFRTIPETSSRVIALNNGEIDMAFGIDANVIKEVRLAGNLISNKDGLNTNYMALNCDERANMATLDKEVRHAISMSINMKELVSSLYDGYATQANSFLPSFIPGYSADVKYPEYNPKKAKEIFEAKGVKTLKMITYSGARQYNPIGGQVLAEAVQAYLAQVGVKASVEVYDWATYRNKLLTDKFDIAFIGWNGDNGDADNFLSLFASDDPINNNSFWINQEYINTIQEGMQVPDGDKRNELYKKAEMILAEETPIIPISHANQIAAYRPNLKDVTFHSIGLFFFKDAYKTN